MTGKLDYAPAIVAFFDTIPTHFEPWFELIQARFPLATNADFFRALSTIIAVNERRVADLQALHERATEIGANLDRTTLVEWTALQEKIRATLVDVLPMGSA